MPRITPEVIERFSRQILVREIGAEGLKRIRDTRIVVMGCGATGTAQAELLARLGVGFIRLVDKDFVDISNLPRTHLLTYRDAKESLPKAVACAEKIKEIDPMIEVEPIVTRITPSNVEKLVEGVDIIIDGTDNLTTRFLINDVAVKKSIPWVFVGFASWYGQVLFINPGKGPCLSCIIPRYMLMREERGDACEILGAVNTAISMLASISATLVLKHVLGILEDYNTMYVVNGKSIEVEKIRVKRRDDCPTCVYKRFEFLESKTLERGVARICGTNAVEITPPKPLNLNLLELSKKYGDELVSANRYTMRIRVDSVVSIIVFSDGRAIVDGTTDEAYALELYRKVVLSKIGGEP